MAGILDEPFCIVTILTALLVFVVVANDPIQDWLASRSGGRIIRTNNMWQEGEGRGRRVKNMEIVKVNRGPGPLYEEILKIRYSDGGTPIIVPNTRFEIYGETLSKGFTKRRYFRIRPENELDALREKNKQWEAAYNSALGQLEKMHGPMEQQMLRLIAPFKRVKEDVLKTAYMPPPGMRRMGGGGPA